MRFLALAGALSFVSLGCSDGESDPVEPPSCAPPLEAGDAIGHADPLGAPAAGEARAGQLVDAGVIPQPAHGRQQIEDGDYLLVNDKVALVIEGPGLSDGYGRYGGEILTLDRVDAGGVLAGESLYNETLIAIGFTVPEVRSVTVVKDGSDGGEAVVRAIGKLAVIPFLEGPFGELFNTDFDLDVAYDYVLAPGAEVATVRMHLANGNEAPVDLGVEKLGSDEFYGFFQGSRMDMVTEAFGFGTPAGLVDWVGFDGGASTFAWRNAEGPIEFGLEQSGFFLFSGPGFMVDGCAITSSERIEIIVGGPEYDGLREAVRRVDGVPAWRAISGRVLDAAGEPVAGAWVHELDEDELYLSRTRAGEDGGFVIHAPDSAVRLVAQALGYRHDGVDVSATENGVDLTFAENGSIHVSATELGSTEPLPVRIQVIPLAPPDATPDAFGLKDEQDGRLHQRFAIDGEATLSVPPGEHRVVVTRGYEYELHDETVAVVAGETTELEVALEHSVDSTGVMCADFHIHTYQSADSSDSHHHKVAGAVVDGLEIPCSSEHEWVVDFGPIVKELGLTEWAFGMSSSELTTFRYGHFGVVPLIPRPGTYNNGAIDWIGKSPGEVFAAVDALEEKPALIVNHPSGGGIGAYFSSMRLDAATGEALDTVNWSENFDAVEVFNSGDFDGNRDGTVRDWFSLLKRGLRVYAIGNSDSHHIRNDPVGYPRTCFWFGHDDPQELTPSLVRDAVLSGNSVVSGGLFMTVMGPSGERPGESVSPGSVTLSVVVAAPSWLAAESLEVIVSGETVETMTLEESGEDSANVYVEDVTVDVTAGDFVVLHARSASDLSPLHPGDRAFAVSNPIFVE